MTAFAVNGVVSLSESLKLLFASPASSKFKQISASLFPFPKTFAGSIASPPDGFECSGMVPNPKAYIIVPSGIWRGCGIADPFNGNPRGYIEATVWIEHPLGPVAGCMGDPRRLGGVGGQNRARNGSGTAHADSCIGMLECGHELTKADSAESFLPKFRIA